MKKTVQIEKLNEDYSDIFTDMAHELCMLLTQILEPFGNLSEDDNTPELYHKNLSTIYSSAKRLQGIINDIVAGAGYDVVTETMRQAFGGFYQTAQPGFAEPVKRDVGEGVSSLSKLDCKFLDSLNRLIEDNISNEELDMDKMTGKLAMSYSTFYRKMKALIGISPKDYIRKIRLHRCLELLRSGNYNVAEAAMITGFNNMGNFRKQFKREYGKAPSAFIP